MKEKPSELRSKVLSRLSKRPRFIPLRGKRIAIDTETTGLHPWLGDRAFAIGFSNERGETSYVEFDVDPFTREVKYDRAVVREIAHYVRTHDARFVFHNAKFDLWMLVMVGIFVPMEKVEDTFFQAHCCNTQMENYKLKDLAERLADYPKDDESELKKLVAKLSRRAKDKLGWKIAYKVTENYDGTLRHQRMTAADYWVPRMLAKLHPELIPDDDELEFAAQACKIYCLGDVKRTILLDRLFTKIAMPELSAECQASDQGQELDLGPRSVQDSYRVECDLMRVVMEMEQRGVRLNKPVCEELRDGSRGTIDDLLRKVNRIAGFKVNLNDHTHIRKFLYDVCKLPVVAYTAGGLPSTSFGRHAAGDMIAKAKNPAVRSLVKCKSNVKALNTFYRRYLHLAVPDPLVEGGWAIHPNYQQRGSDDPKHWKKGSGKGGVQTTRFSCTDPNFQNVAGEGTTQGAEPIYARKPFGPREGHRWLHNDYDNMEMREFADFAQEENMLEAFRAGRDVHTEVANRVWGGKYNKRGIKQLFHALELDGSGLEYSLKKDELKHAWDYLEIRGDVTRYGYKDRLRLAEEWFRKHDWDIVDSEGAIKKKTVRTRSKILSFTKIYGGKPPRVALQMRIPLEDAIEILQVYDEQFPRINPFMYEMQKKAYKDGFVLTAFGDRITVDRRFAYRATNYRIQGSAAQLMKRRLIALNKLLKDMDVPAWIVATIHDEIITEIRRTAFTLPLIRRICECLEDTEGAFGIRMKVSAETVSERWDVKKKIKGIGDEWRPAPGLN